MRFADRVRSLLAKKGWTQDRLESEADLGKGYVSRILSGDRQRIGIPAMQRMATALQVDYAWLATGKEGVGNASGGFGTTQQKTLDQIDGYQDAEIEVARQAPEVPLDVFRAVRKTRLAVPPAVVTADFLSEFVFMQMRIMHPVVPNQSGSRRIQRVGDADSQEPKAASRGRRRG